MNVGDVIVSVAADLRDFIAGMNTAVAMARASASQAETEFRNAFGMIDSEGGRVTQALASKFSEIGRIVSGIMISQAFYRITNDIQQATSSVFSYAQALEVAQMKWTALLGSAQQGTQFVQAMQQFAATTPFDLTGVSDAATKISMMGVSENQILPVLRTVGNAVAMNGGGTDELTHIVTALRQLYESPTADKQDINQLIQGGGINAPKYLKDAFGFTGAQVQKIGDQGISGAQAVNAILQGIAKDPAYTDAMAKMNKTVTGMIENIKDSANYLGSLVITKPFDALKTVLQDINGLIDKLITGYQNGGIAGVLDSLIPKGWQGPINEFYQALKGMFGAIGQLWQALQPILKVFSSDVGTAIYTLIVAFTAFVRSLADVLQALAPIAPVIGHVLFALLTLTVLTVVAEWFVKLTTAIKTFVQWLAITEVVESLGAAIAALVAAPELLAILAIAGVMAYFGLQTQQASAWLHQLKDEFLGFLGISTGANIFNVDNTNAGTDAAKQAQDAYNKLDGTLQDFSSNQDNAANATDKNKKATQSATRANQLYIESFDEVFRVPDQTGTPGTGTPGSGGGGGGTPGGGTPGGNNGGGSGGNNGFPNLPFTPFGGIGLPGAIGLPKINLDFLMKPFQELGKVIQDVLDWLKQFEGLLASLPAFFPLIALNSILDLLKRFGTAIDVLVRTVGNFSINTQGAFGAIGRSIGDFGINVQNAFNRLVDRVGQLNILIPQLVRHVGDFNIAGKTLGSILQGVGDWAGNTAAEFQRLVDSVGKLGINFGSTLVSISQGTAGMVAAIAAIIAIIVKLIQSIGDLPGKAQGALANMPAILFVPFSYIGVQVQTVMNTVQSYIFSLASNIPGLVSSIPGELWSAFSYLEGQVQGVVNNVTSIFSRLGNNLSFVTSNIPTILYTAISFMPGQAQGVVNGVIGAFNWLPGALQGVMNSVSNVLAAPFNNIANLAWSAGDAVYNAFATLPQDIYNAISSIPRMVSNVLGQIHIPSFATSITMAGMTVAAGYTLLRNMLPGFANGGIVGADTIARIGEGGKKEAIIPLENSGAMNPFADAVANRLNSLSGGNQGSQQILYVGNLIADDRGLKELERRMRVIRLSENQRGVFK